MQSILRIACLCVLLPMACVDVRAKPDTPEATQAQAEQARGKLRQPAFALLAGQQDGFEAEWQEQLRQQLIVGTRGSPDAISDAIATAMAVFAAGAYLPSADDASVDAFFQQQRILVSRARTDGRLCARLLNTPSARRDSAGEVPWLMQKPYRDRQAALQQAVTQLLLSGNGKPPRLLPPDDAERFMQRTASQMAARFGPDSLQDYEAMLDDNAGPAQRCKGLYQLMETINAQAPELRAQMVRQFFGD
jgi:hypothetical protein